MIKNTSNWLARLSLTPVRREGSDECWVRRSHDRTAKNKDTCLEQKSFYKEAKAVKGSDTFSYQWKNADWLFSTQQNLDSFKLSPEKYEPAYGGYCAYGTSRGYKAPAIADTWTIINQKLYFNYNMKVKELWDKDRNRYIDSANSKWATIKNL